MPAFPLNGASPGHATVLLLEQKSRDLQEIQAASAQDSTVN